MTSRRPRPAAAAFSLVELLVVLAILAILLAILLPALRRVRQAADRATCAANLRQVGALLYAYAGDNRGELPPVYAPPADGGAPVPTAWFSPLVDRRGGGVSLLVAPPIGTAPQAYARDAKLFLCPGDALFAAARPTPDDFGSFAKWGAPATNPETRTMSYVYAYVPEGGDFYDFGGPSDAGDAPGWHPAAFAGFERHKVSGKGAASAAVLYEFSLLHSRGPALRFDPHGPDGNVLYLDGHVVNVRRADVPVLDEARSRVPGWFDYMRREFLPAVDRSGPRP